MNPSIEASFASISTMSWSALTSGSESGRDSYLGSKCWWGDCRFVASHDVSAGISLPRSISASLMVVYNDGADLVPKGRCRQRKASFTTVEMHVATICAFVRTRRYAVSRSVFPIRVRFKGHLLRMPAIMWSILRSQNL